MLSEEEIKKFKEIRDSCFTGREAMMERMIRYEKYFLLDLEIAKNISLEIEEFLRQGCIDKQKNHANPQLHDSCLAKDVDGTESGKFLTLDFRGNMFNVASVDLVPGKIPDANINFTILEKNLLEPKTSATQMFDFFAEKTSEFLEKNPEFMDSDASFSVSFPCDQKRVDSAILRHWTKSFGTGRETVDPIEGQDVSQLMTNALHRQKLSTKIKVLLNDSTAALLTGRHEAIVRGQLPCAASVVIGSGLNAAYMPRFPEEFGFIGKYVITEIGNFKGSSLPMTNVDQELDFASTNPHSQILEKMCSRAYLGEIGRRSIVKILQHRAPAASWHPLSLSSSRCCQIASECENNREVARQVMTKLWNEECDPDVVEVVSRICKAVLDRAEWLIAAVVAAVARSTSLLQPAMGGVSVALEERMGGKAIFFTDSVRTKAESILGDLASSFELIEVAECAAYGGALAQV